MGRRELCCLLACCGLGRRCRRLMVDVVDVEEEERVARKSHSARWAPILFWAIEELDWPPRN